MLQLSYIAAFVFCVAVAAYGILLTENLRREHPENKTYTKLIFQQAFIYVFAFYGIWGHLLFSWLLRSELADRDLISKISFFLFVFAIPFLAFSWWFLLEIAASLNLPSIKRPTVSILYISALVLSGSVLFILPDEQSLIEKTIRILTLGNLIVMAMAGIFFMPNRKSKLQFRTRSFIAIVFILAGVITGSGLFFYHLNPWLTLLFIFFIFISSTWMPVLLKYIIGVEPKISLPLSGCFDSFCEKYGISKREAEIVQLVCDGLTNREIAGKLFITLQTVKDHTSRIYLKSGVRNRTELAKLAREV